MASRTWWPVLLLAATSLASAAPSRDAVLDHALKAGESTWVKATGGPERLGVRELFQYALTLCEADKQTWRVPLLLQRAADLQDRDPASPGYGNFRWYARQDTVLDYNAVEFCMQQAVVLWNRHRALLDDFGRAALRELMAYGLEGCLRHRVASSYTNIALMNAGNLVLLGEALDRPEATDEGQARLNAFVFYTWQAGIHEFGSSTYYGTDLDDLVVLERFAVRPQVKETAQALLTLFWTDLAACWFAPGQKLAGARSREYDYRFGTGYLDVPLWVEGWLPDDATGGGTAATLSLSAGWHPPARLKTLNETVYPRLVRQSWGQAEAESRTTWISRHVTLGTSSAAYHNMDVLLAADLAGPRRQARIGFIPDGRHDPYGTQRVAEGPHDKAIHLRPFWTAAQRGRDALGLVVYRVGDLPPETKTLESHLLLPLEVDSVWVGDERVRAAVDQPFDQVVAPGRPVVVANGPGAVAIRILWTRGRGGGPAPVRLIHDRGERVFRLTVLHHAEAGADGPRPGALFWVRAADALTEDGLTGWRRAFAAAAAEVTAGASGIVAAVTGQDGAVAVSAAAPYAVPARLDPPPYRGVMELNGSEIGRPVLEALAPVRDYLREVDAQQTVLVGAEPVEIEAEAGVVVPPMARGRDEGASGGAFVWAPGPPGGRAGHSGGVSWRLDVREAGRYYLWGRVQAPTPDDDSFFVQLVGERELLPPTAWHTGTAESWTWRPVTLGPGTEPTAVELPAGRCALWLLCREDGARIDRLRLARKADDGPH